MSASHRRFYHREGEPKTPEATASIKNSRNDVNVLNDINATVSFLKGCATADTSRLGIVGFCMGGRIAFLGAAATTLFKAAVDFYGGGCLLAMGRPPDAGKLGRQCLAARSKAISANSTKIRRPMRCASSTLSSHRLGKPHEFFFYPDTHHGFNRSGWKATSPTMMQLLGRGRLEFFAKHLGCRGAEKSRRRVS